MKQYATKIGIAGLLIWSGGALFNSLASALPTFEILFFALGLGFLAGAMHLTFTQTWYKVKQQSLYFLLGFCGVFGNELCYVSAFKFAPAAHITLINYLWPIVVIAFSSVIAKDHFCVRTMLAALIGLASVAFYILQDPNVHIASEYWFGYFLVFLGTVMWSMYILINRRANTIPSEMITLYCGCGAVISLLIHVNTENFVIPDLQQSLALLWLGVMSMFLAFKCWNIGILHGKIGMLCVLSYNNVFFSTILLIIFNQASFDPQILFSVLGLMLSSLLSIFEFKILKENLKNYIKLKYYKPIKPTQR